MLAGVSLVRFARLACVCVRASDFCSVWPHKVFRFQNVCRPNYVLHSALANENVALTRRIRPIAHICGIYDEYGVYEQFYICINIRMLSFSVCFLHRVPTNHTQTHTHTRLAYQHIGQNLCAVHTHTEMAFCRSSSESHMSQIQRTHTHNPHNISAHVSEMRLTDRHSVACIGSI